MRITEAAACFVPATGTTIALVKSQSRENRKSVGQSESNDRRKTIQTARFFLRGAGKPAALSAKPPQHFQAITGHFETVLSQAVVQLRVELFE